MVISKTLEEKSLEDVVNLVQRHATGGKPKRKEKPSVPQTPLQGRD